VLVALVALWYVSVGVGSGISARARMGDRHVRTMAKQKKTSGTKEIRNRQAYFAYEVLEKVEAGIVLIGSEVKSVRAGDVSFADAYVRIDGGEAWLVNLHIAEYKNAKDFGHEPRRRRKLLLHRREIRKLAEKAELKGLTLIPLRLYFTGRGFAKIEIGVCRGKKLHDKRESAKKRDAQREIDREMARYKG